MLILTRKLNEQIVVGDSICITYLETRDRQAILAIEGPAETTIESDETRARGGHADLRSGSPSRATVEDASTKHPADQVTGAITYGGQRSMLLR